MIGIIDYGVGNIGSIRNGLEFLNIPHIISHHTKDLSSCEGIILPGVGAFNVAMQNIIKQNVDTTISDFLKTGKIFLANMKNIITLTVVMITALLIP